MDEPVHYLRIFEGEPLPEISKYSPFRAVVVIEAPYSERWQNDVSRWLVASGCLYMMAWGPNCTTWDDSVDYANLDQFEFGDIPDEHFVMTTWHERDSLDEVFWFAGFCAHHGNVELVNTLIIHISAEDAAEPMLRRFADAQERHT